MREKGEIISDSLDALAKIPGEGKVMVEHEHLFLEVWIDIRDSLENFREAIMGFMLSTEVIEKALKDDDQ